MEAERRSDGMADGEGDAGGGWTHWVTTTIGQLSQGGQGEMGHRGGDVKSTNKAFRRLKPVGESR